MKCLLLVATASLAVVSARPIHASMPNQVNRRDARPPLFDDFHGKVANTPSPDGKDVGRGELDVQWASNMPIADIEEPKGAGASQPGPKATSATTNETAPSSANDPIQVNPSNKTDPIEPSTGQPDERAVHATPRADGTLLIREEPNGPIVGKTPDGRVVRAGLSGNDWTVGRPNAEELLAGSTGSKSTGKAGALVDPEEPLGTVMGVTDDGKAIVNGFGGTNWSEGSSHRNNSLHAREIGPDGLDGPNGRVIGKTADGKSIVTGHVGSDWSVGLLGPKRSVIGEEGPHGRVIGKTADGKDIFSGFSGSGLPADYPEIPDRKRSNIGDEGPHGRVIGKTADGKDVVTGFSGSGFDAGYDADDPEVPDRKRSNIGDEGPHGEVIGKTADGKDIFSGFSGSGFDAGYDAGYPKIPDRKRPLVDRPGRTGRHANVGPRDPDAQVLTEGPIVTDPDYFGPTVPGMGKPFKHGNLGDDWWPNVPAALKPKPCPP